VAVQHCASINNPLFNNQQSHYRPRAEMHGDSRGQKFNRQNAILPRSRCPVRDRLSASYRSVSLTDQRALRYGIFTGYSSVCAERLVWNLLPRRPEARILHSPPRYEEDCRSGSTARQTMPLVAAMRYERSNRSSSATSLCGRLSVHRQVRDDWSSRPEVARSSLAPAATSIPRINSPHHIAAKANPVEAPV
jgi:hypothetical protein